MTYLSAAFLFASYTIVPWEVAIVLLLGGSVLIWLRAGGDARELFTRGGASTRLLLLTGCLAVGFGVTIVAVRHQLGLRHLADATDASGVVVAAGVAAVVGGLMNALPEEVIFRGVFLRSFVTWGPPSAVAASGILFALAHLPNAVLSWGSTGAVLVVRLVYLAAVGALLAWAVLRTGTIWVAILWHAGTNQASVMADLLGATAPALSAAQQAWDLVFLVGEAVVLWLLVRYGWSRRSAVPTT